MMGEPEGGSVAGSAKRGRPRSVRGAMPIALTLRAGEAWRQWLDAYGEAKGMTSADLVELALAQMAKRDKHPTPPKRDE
jgi:hypothetical protein